MANQRPNAETARDLKALPADLHPLYQRLADDGAIWQAASAERLASLAQSLVAEVERIASDGLPAARAKDTFESVPIEPSNGTYATPLPMHRHRRGWIAGALAVVAAVVVVGLLALVLQGAFAGQETIGSRISNASQGKWQVLDKLSEQPTAGKAAPIIAPNNPQVVYEATDMVTDSAEASKVVTYASLRRTEDGGETWKTLALPLPLADIDMIEIHISPVNAQTVFMTLWDRSSATCDPIVVDSIAARVDKGCGYGYISTDAGNTWQKPALPVRGILNTGGAIVAQDGRLYASNVCEDDTCVHLLMSSDGGLTWHLIDGQITASKRHICDFAAMAGGQTVYAVVSRVGCVQPPGEKTLWRSDDVGAHWSQLGTLLPNLQTRHYVLLFNGTLPNYSSMLTAPRAELHGLLYLNMPYLTDNASPIFLYSEDRGVTWKSTPPVPVTRPTKIADPQELPIGETAVLSDGSLFYLPLYPYDNYGKDVTPFIWTPDNSAWHRLPQLPAGLIGFGSIVVTPGANGHDTITMVLFPTPGDTSSSLMYTVFRYQM